MRSFPVFARASAFASSFSSAFAIWAALAGSTLLSPSAVGKPPPAGVAAPAPERPLAESFVAFDVRDAATNASIPCKLTFIGVEGSHDPVFTRNDIGRQEGDGAIAAYNRVMAINGVGYARVPHGTYDVYVSRGIEWDLAVVKRLEVTPRGAHLTARLSHVVDTTGWISADFHVHAASSPDSHVPMLDRLYEFVSDGVEVITSTDHNVVSDYGPLIRELGVGHYLASLVGDELTTATWGHFGAFPLAHELERAGHGAVSVRGKPGEFFAEARAQTPEVVIDVHHPRIDGEIGYFSLGQLDAVTDRAGRPGFSWDFDAVEVMNGYQDPVRVSVDRVIADWFALIEHGHVVTATGNSDTHHLDYNIGGYPRNYLRVEDDRPERIEAAPLARAVKRHRSFFTTAPFVRLSAGGLGLGELCPAPGGKAKVTIDVEAAPWVDVDLVILYVDGRETKRWKLTDVGRTLRLHDEVEVQTRQVQGVAKDSFVVARVEGRKPLGPVVGDGKRFTVYPFALTNPLFLDANGDGQFTPALAEVHGHPASKP